MFNAKANLAGIDIHERSFSNASQSYILQVAEVRKEWEGFKDYEQKRRTEYSEQKRAAPVLANKNSVSDR